MDEKRSKVYSSLLGRKVKCVIGGKEETLEDHLRRIKGPLIILNSRVETLKEGQRSGLLIEDIFPESKDKEKSH